MSTSCPPSPAVPPPGYLVAVRAAARDLVAATIAWDEASAGHGPGPESDAARDALLAALDRTGAQFPAEGVITALAGIASALLAQLARARMPGQPGQAGDREARAAVWAVFDADDAARVAGAGPGHERR